MIHYLAVGADIAWLISSGGPRCGCEDYGLGYTAGDGYSDGELNSARADYGEGYGTGLGYGDGAGHDGEGNGDGSGHGREVGVTYSEFDVLSALLLLTYG